MTSSVDSLLADQYPDAIIASTLDGIVTLWNKGSETIFGYTAEEAVGRELIKLIIPENRIDDEVALTRQAALEGTATVEGLRWKKNLSLVYVSITKRAIKNGEGIVESFLSSTKDITHLKVLRDAKLVQSRYGEILESTPDGIVIVNPTGRIIFASLQAQMLFGYEPNELLGKPVEVLLPDHFRGAHVGHRAQFFITPRTRTMGVGLELYGLRKDGSEFPVEISLSPLQTEEGMLVMSAIRDTTYKKSVEKQMRERTRELEAANTELGAFSYSVSHDLRAPLRAINGFCRIILDEYSEGLQPELLRYLGLITKNTVHMGQLVDDLLRFSQLSRQQLQMQPINMSTLVMTVIEEQTTEVERTRIRFNVQELPSCQGDQALMKQVWTNLISNAVKFSRGAAAPSIDIGITSANGHATYFIRDNGVGFDMEYAHKLFGVFQRLHRTEDFEGTGVGLALVQRIIHRHGGKVWAGSEPGKGSTFFFTLEGPGIHE
jgi:PAS domain S-box-containing protein